MLCCTLYTGVLSFNRHPDTGMSWAESQFRSYVRTRHTAELARKPALTLIHCSLLVASDSVADVLSCSFDWIDNVLRDCFLHVAAGVLGLALVLL